MYLWKSKHHNYTQGRQRTSPRLTWNGFLNWPWSRWSHRKYCHWQKQENSQSYKRINTLLLVLTAYKGRSRSWSFLPLQQAETPPDKAGFPPHPPIFILTGSRQPALMHRSEGTINWSSPSHGQVCTRLWWTTSMRTLQQPSHQGHVQVSQGKGKRNTCWSLTSLGAKLHGGTAALVLHSRQRWPGPSHTISRRVSQDCHCFKQIKMYCSPKQGLRQQSFSSVLPKQRCLTTVAA